MKRTPLKRPTYAEALAKKRVQDAKRQGKRVTEANRRQSAQATAYPETSKERRTRSIRKDTPTQKETLDNILSVHQKELMEKRV